MVDRCKACRGTGHNMFDGSRYKMCKDCGKNENCAGNDTGIYPCPDFVALNEGCRLVENNVILAPHDPGSPPSWAPGGPGITVFWVDRPLFNKLKELRHKKPCDICPDQIKSTCKVATHAEVD